MRPILIVLLVAYHAFCPWDGKWDAFTGFMPNDAYKWFDRGVYAFMLESFVFISGYIWAFQRNEQGRKESLKQLISKKFNRLIVPSIVFSILYLLVLQPNGLIINGIIGGGKLLLTILGGAGHMWFLLMLFWCFVYTWLIEQIKIDSKYKLLITILLMSLVILPNYFRMSQAFKYLPFFYGGYFVRGHISRIRNGINTRSVVGLWILFIITFIGLYFVRDNYLPILRSTSSVLFKYATTGCQFVYSAIGTVAFFATAIVITDKHRLPKRYIEVGKLCFGVYIWQQFILKIIYYKTDIPIYIGSAFLPWLSFLITLLLSYYLAKVTKEI